MDSYAPRHPFLRALGARVPLGRPFGVPVELHVLAIVLTVGLATWEWSRVGVSFAPAFVAATIAAIVLYAVIWTHEMGHVLAGRRWNIPTHRITLWPLGGLAHLAAPAPSPRADIVIALAGPATHVAGLALAWPLHALFPYGSGPLWDGVDLRGVAIETFFYLQTVLALFNLLPFLPMDGGRVLMGALTLKLGENRALRIAARVGLYGAIGMGIYAIVFRGGWQGGLLLAIALNNGLICGRLMQMARLGGRWYDERVRDPWERDAEAWRTGSAGDARSSARRSDRAARKAAQRAAKEVERRRAEDEEIDGLLERVGAVGLAGLSGRERRRLDALSKRRGRPSPR